jgi:predicted acetyltransferase
MNTIKLVKASMTDIEKIFDLHSEIGPDDGGFTNSAHALNKKEFNNYLQGVIDISHGINMPDGYVPQTTYFLSINTEFVAMSRLRHLLNDHLLKHGGHIGYYVRKKYRRLGYGNVVLSATLNEAYHRNIDKVLLTVKSTNSASRKIILNQGGIFEKEDNVSGLCHYWIYKNCLTSH